MNSLIINDHEMKMIKIDFNKFKISVFTQGQIDFDFNVTLSNNNDDKILPSFHIDKSDKIIPEWVKPNIKIISDWITKETK